MSMVEAKNGLNVPSGSAISQPTEPPENFTEAPWCTETLIGLARSRHTPELFECTGSDEDYEAAQWLIEETRYKEGDGAKQSWERIERHIAWMTEDNSPSWWVIGRGQRSEVTLRHVVGYDKTTDKLTGRNWRDVETKANEVAWYPSRRTPYDPDPGAFEELPGPIPSNTLLFADNEPALSALPVEERVAEPLVFPKITIEEIHDVQDGAEPPGETEQQEMHALPSPVEKWPLTKRGMTMEEYNALFAIIKEEEPSITTGFRMLDDGSFALAIEWAENQWVPVRSEAEWRSDPLVKSAARKAAQYGEAKQCRDQ
jgi:hypothetical protein